MNRPPRNVSEFMHGGRQDQLLVRADAAIEEARRLCFKRVQEARPADAILKRAAQARAFQSGLEPASAIALLVRMHSPV